MKKLSILTAILGCVIFFFSSCNQEKEVGMLSDMFGRWQNVNNTKEYYVFQQATADMEGFYWGKDWDENERKESDLDYHGNGWFQWQKGTNYIRMAYMLSISEATPSVDYELISLTSEQMVFSTGRETITLKKIQEKE